MDVQVVATITSLAIIIIFTARGCYLCLQGLVNDKAGWWITLGEGLSCLAWILLGLDVLAYNLLILSEFITGAIFWTAMACKCTSVVVKSEGGYKGIRDTYSHRKLW